MKKKLAAMMITAVMCASLAGCGSGGGSTQAASTAAPAGTSAAAQSAAAGEASTAAAAAEASSTDPASRYGGTLHVAQESLEYCVTLGTPFATTGSLQETPFTAIYDKLWTRGADGKVKLVLADDYSVSDDGLTYTFKIKQGIKFHDGSDLNAEVVAWNYNKIVEYGYITAIESAKALDDYTVEVKLSVSNPFFLMSNADRTPFYIASKANFDKIGEEEAKTHPVGTGPFKFVSMEVGQSVILEKNEDYWRTDDDGSKLPYLDGIEISAISDPTVAAAALSNKEIELYVGTLDDLKMNLDVYGIENFNIDRGSVPTKACGIRFMANSRNAKLFTDERLRKAVAYAIDGEAIAAAYTGGEMEYTEQIAVAGGDDYIENPVVYGYEPEKAKELLKEAGYPDGFEIELNIDTTPFSQNLAELYQYYLGEVGIKVKIMSYANAERNEIQDRDDTWDQILVSQTSINGDSSNVWNNCSPSRKKWCNMLPFETEPEWVELWNKVAEQKNTEDAYKALAEYFAYAQEHCTQYLFMHNYPDFKYSVPEVQLQSAKNGSRWLDCGIVYLNK